MKKNIIFIFVFILGFSVSSFAQDEAESNVFKKNTFYLELGGNSGVGSLNYERQLMNRVGLGFKVGLGANLIGTSTFHLSVPVGLTYSLNLKNKKHFLEFGTGVTFVKTYGELAGEPIAPDGKDYLMLVPSFGTRHYLGKAQRTLIRATFTPQVQLFRGGQVIPSFGFSIGRTF